MKYNLRIHRHNDISIYYRRIVGRIIINRRYTYNGGFRTRTGQKGIPPLNIVVIDLRKVYPVITCNDIVSEVSLHKKHMSSGEIKLKSPPAFGRPSRREHDTTRRSLEKPSINVLGNNRLEITFYLPMGQTNFARNTLSTRMIIIIIIRIRLLLSLLFGLG